MTKSLIQNEKDIVECPYCGHIQEFFKDKVKTTVVCGEYETNCRYIVPGIDPDGVSGCGRPFEVRDNGDVEMSALYAIEHVRAIPINGLMRGMGGPGQLVDSYGINVRTAYDDVREALEND